MGTNNSVPQKNIGNGKLPAVLLGVLLVAAVAIGIWFFKPDSSTASKGTRAGHEPEQNEERIARGKVSAFEHNLKVYLDSNNSFASIAQDKLEGDDLLNTAFLSNSKVKEVHSPVLSPENSNQKKGFVVTTPGNAVLAFIQYGDYGKTLAPDKTAPFALPFSPAKLIPVSVLYFPYNVADAVTEQKAWLDLKLFIENNRSDIEALFIAGHTCSLGGEEYNLGLSVRRAQYIADSFWGKGIKVMAAGYGSQSPSHTNDSEDGRSQNRRVVVYIVPKDADK